MGRLKSIFWETIELSSRCRSYVFLFVLAALAVLPVRLLESSPNLSICHRLWGEYCYSVGITRGVSSLLKGDFARMLDYNFLAVPTVVIMISIIIYDFRKKWKKLR